jgi:hypothetical protein
LLKKHLVCKIDKANKLIMRLNNGPINVLVTTKDRINKDIFFIDSKTGNLMAKKPDGTNMPVTIGTYVNVSIESRQFNDQDNIIMAMGIMENLASDEEIKNNYENEYGTDEPIIYDDYVKQEGEDDTAEITETAETTESDNANNANNANKDSEYSINTSQTTEKVINSTDTLSETSEL